MFTYSKTIMKYVSVLFLTISCSSDVSGPDGAKVEMKDGRYLIVDNTGKKWDVTHAKEKYGMEPAEFQFGLGPFAIKPILNPKMLSPGDTGYPFDNETFLVLATEINNDPRAYSIGVLSIHEIANEIFADAHVAVAY
ncbi:DUF3179 domain-containing protein [candidate division KSB1 bacterium]|nr:DUF3179 domain-containing protein [candidate division KSB1 bacterium]